MRALRGEFVRGDGLILPNNVSLAGSQAILTAWARGTVPTFVFGLIKGSPTLTMTETNVGEPTIGHNGYNRIAVTRDVNGWPVFGNVGVENYIGTKPLVFTPTGGAFDQPIQRVALFDSLTKDPAHNIYSMSAPLQNEVILDVSTPVEQRTFYYRLYL